MHERLSLWMPMRGRRAACQLLLLAAAACAPLLSAAALVSSLLDSAVVYEFPSENYLGSGPRLVAPGISWSARSASAVFGYTAGYSFDENGSWLGMAMIGTNDGRSSMSLSFATPVAGVGAYLNYAPSVSGSPAVIAIYDAAGVLLDSYRLDFTTDGSLNSGEFRGFLLPSAGISRLTLSGGLIGAAHLQVQVTALDAVLPAVPEPRTAAMLGIGLLALLVGSARRASRFRR